MARMTERMKEIFEKQETLVLATASKDGIPHVVPINAKKIIDEETLLISDQFFHKTLFNLRENPRVAITMWDKLEGYQIKGTVTIETAGTRFEETARWIDAVGKKLNIPLRSKGALIVKIEELYNVSPGEQAGARLA
jgi:uncharacterized protein